MLLNMHVSKHALLWGALTNCKLGTRLCCKRGVHSCAGVVVASWQVASHAGRVISVWRSDRVLHVYLDWMLLRKALPRVQQLAGCGRHVCGKQHRAQLSCGHWSWLPLQAGK